MTDDRDHELAEDEERDGDADESASKTPITEDPDAPDSNEASVEEGDEEVPEDAVDDEAVREMAEEDDAYDSED